MARDTDLSLRSQVIYSVYVRSHTPEGTFEGVRRDLERIRALGTDILWLLPIHPIGVEAHKGTLGCPYAIRDYREVNPEYGTREDFVRLVEEAHRLGMRCIIDVVYHHTSPDSVLAKSHPEWFYHRPDGSLGNQVGDWTDVVDLDFSHPELWDYLIETLRGWAEVVDGFRCDVAPLVPLDFWLRARREVARVRPGCLWLAESVQPGFLRHMRALGVDALSDGELYQAFDLCYDYDLYDTLADVLAGRVPLAAYCEGLNRQEAAYPRNYVKLRFLENHDVPRARAMIPKDAALRAWTAFLYFQKGAALLYGGQEVGARSLPSLFEREPVDWAAGPDLSGLLRRLGELKRDPLFTHGAFEARALPGDVALAFYTQSSRRLAGLFPLRGEACLADAGLPDGRYENLLDGSTVEVTRGRVSTDGESVILAL